jgi:hypothetical protein
VKIKEITVTASKQINFGEFSSQVSITFESEKGEDETLVKSQTREYQTLCDECVEEDIATQILRKKERTKKDK